MKNCGGYDDVSFLQVQETTSAFPDKITVHVSSPVNGME